MNARARRRARANHPSAGTPTPYMVHRGRGFCLDGDFVEAVTDSAGVACGRPCLETFLVESGLMWGIEGPYPIYVGSRTAPVPGFDYKGQQWHEYWSWYPVTPRELGYRSDRTDSRVRSNICIGCGELVEKGRINESL